MTISLRDLAQIDQHWAVQSLSGEMRATALDLADLLLVKSSLGQLLHNNANSIVSEFALVEKVAMVYELAAIEGLNVLLHPAKSNESLALQKSAQAGAHRAFGLYRILPIPSDTNKRIFHVLNLAGLAYCGERWTDLRRWFVDNQESFAIPSIADVSWDTRVLYRLFDAWIRLLRKDRWDDLEQISLIILGLRTDQAEFEKQLLEGAAGHGQSIALRLIALYHFAKATERLAMYMLQGEPSSIATELDQHFEAAVKAAQKSQDSQFEMILRWLHVASRKMAAGHTITVPAGFIAKHGGLTIAGASVSASALTITGQVECHGNITRTEFSAITGSVDLNDYTDSGATTGGDASLTMTGLTMAGLTMAALTATGV